MLVVPVCAGPLLIDLDWFAELNQHLAAKTVTVDVVQATRNDCQVFGTASGRFKGDARRAGLELDQPGFGMAYALGEYAHAVAGLNDLVHAIECLLVVNLTLVFLAPEDGYRTTGIKQRSEAPVFPELGIGQEVQRPAPASGGQQPAVHERIGVVAGEDDRPVPGHVFGTDDVDSPKECSGDEMDQCDDEKLQHRRPKFPASRR